MIQKKRVARLISVFSKSEIQNLFKKARTVFKQKELEIRLAPKSLDYGRILIVIPRSVGNAVARNLIRRRIKSIFYEQAFYEKAYDSIMLVYSGASDLSFDDLTQILFKAYESVKTS